MTPEEKVCEIKVYYALYALVWLTVAIPLGQVVYLITSDGSLAFATCIASFVQSVRMLNHSIAAYLISKRTGEAEQEIFIEQTRNRGF